MQAFPKGTSTFGVRNCSRPTLLPPQPFHFFLQSRHAQPQIGWAFMMAVSCTKAMLVILFFMHVKYEANWKYVLTIPQFSLNI